MRTKLFIILSGFLLTAACLFAGGSNVEVEKAVHSTPTTTLSAAQIAEIEAYGRLTMPAAAQNIQFYRETGGMDGFLALKFELPPDALSVFLDQAGYDEPLAVPYQLRDILGLLYPLSEQIDGWPTMAEWEQMLGDPALILLTATTSEPGFSRTVLVDQTDGDLFVIYLVHHAL